MTRRNSSPGQRYRAAERKWKAAWDQVLKYRAMGDVRKAKLAEQKAARLSEKWQSLPYPAASASEAWKRHFNPHSTQKSVSLKNFTGTITRNRNGSVTMRESAKTAGHAKIVGKK